MALANANVVDSIVEDKETGELVLSLFDEVGWDDPAAHWGLLCEKLDRYLGFLVSGEILDHYPQAEPAGYTIGIVFRFVPPEEIASALEKSQQFVAAYGYSLLWKVQLGDDEPPQSPAGYH